tara:strand:+ start:454 stop:633 length:180 start_codon:yes stop_codon:yes gene_type:complete
MMDKYENKIYGGKNYINAMICLSHEQRRKLEEIKKKMKCKTINSTIEKLLITAIKEKEL